MELNLSKMFEKQAKLNAEIYRKHDLSFQEIKDESKLALMAEIMELCNETRCFNYWSTKKRSADDVVLEEYADVLHFSFSQALYYKVDPNIKINPVKKEVNKKELVLKFLSLIKLYDNLHDEKSCQAFLVHLLELGFSLGYDFEQIQNAYFKKWDKNWAIQAAIN